MIGIFLQLANTAIANIKVNAANDNLFGINYFFYLD